jgi:nucleoside-diphosphate-sugar epimerase
MRVLVTGHNGYIGSVMAPFLEQAGHEVVGLDSYLFERCLHGPPTPEPTPSLRIDLRDVDTHLLRGFDAVVHLAALSNDPLGNLEPEHTYDINHAASVRLAVAAKEAGVARFLYSSSCSIYGASDTDSVLDETAPMVPVTPYAESKVRVEADLQALADDTFTPVYMRNATAYGWSPRLRCDIVLNDLVASAMLTRRILVLSDGTPWRPMVHIEDISRGFLAALEAPRDAVHNQAFNVGAARENYQVSEIAQIVNETVPDCEVVITSETGPDPRSYRVDFAKIGERLPSFQPEWDLRRGARQLYDNYQHHGMPEEQYRKLFKRLPWITRMLTEGQLDASLRWRADRAATATA